MGNSESSSEFPPPSNNYNGSQSKRRSSSTASASASAEEEEKQETNTSSAILKVGATIAAGTALALGAYTLMSSHSEDSDGARKRLGAQMEALDSRGRGFSSASGTVVKNNNFVKHQGDPDQYSGLQMIKIMSYNVWFREDVEVEKRMEAIGELIQEHNPDIIFLQEVTPYIYELFQDSSWWSNYQCSVTPQKARTRRYFCMLLSKLPVKQLTCEPFKNSTMGRELCIAEVAAGANPKRLAVATSHLESPTPPEMNSAERVDQAKEAVRILNSAPNAIFGGDMNWDENNDGPFPLLDGWYDAWSAEKPREDGCTFDTKSNAMLKGNYPLRKRLDRFVCKLKDFKLAEVQMIGMDAIPGISYNRKGKELPVLPSDHYGLILAICPM